MMMRAKVELAEKAMQMQNTKGIQESMFLRKGMKSQMLKKHREMGKEIPKDTTNTKNKAKNKDLEIDSAVDFLTKQEKVKDLELSDTAVTKLETLHHEEQSLKTKK
jgi:hypothetical protein